MNALTFHGITFDVVDQNGTPWLKSSQIAEALGYADEKSITRIFARHADEFTGEMTGGVKLTTPGGEQEVRIFSPRGCYAIGMFARTKIASEFRKWVLDVLEGKTAVPQPSPAPRTRKALPGGLTIDQQDAIKALVRSRADALPQDKRAKAAITLWSAVNAKFGTTGKKDGYKNIPADQFGEALSVVARVALEGELLPPGPQISPELSNAIARRTHAIAMNQYGVVRKMIEEMVTGNLKCGASEQECFQYVADFGGLAEESVLVNKWDLVQMARLVSGVVNAAGGAISVIQRLEQNYGIELYPRDSTGNLPPQLMQVMLGAGPVMRGMI